MTTKIPPKKRAATTASALVAPRANRALVDSGDARFSEVIALIEAARARGYQAVNTALVGHYWELGSYISAKIATAEWGDGVVEELAADLATRYPGVRGYTRRNLFRMRQFFEAYRAHKKVSPLVTQLPWTHHLIILSEAKPVETREFYILAAIKERWPKRELERQIRTGAVLRAAALPKKVSPAVTQIHPTALDELKNEKFKPADLGQLSFYVEALDRDAKKPHERPSIGVLLCATKDDEVVEYALARTTSPTLVAEYQTFLPPKEVLRAKLHELYALLAPSGDCSLVDGDQHG